MNVTQKATPSKEGQLALNALQSAVTKVLEKKKRLGQYAVIWQDGKPKIIVPNEQHQTQGHPQTGNAV